MSSCTEPVKTGISTVCVEYGRPKWPVTILNHTNTQTDMFNHTDRHPWYRKMFWFLIFGTLCSYDPPWRGFFAYRQKTVSVASLSRPCLIITWVRTANDVYICTRGWESTVKPPWFQKTKVWNTSNTQSHEHTRPSTYTDPPNDPVHPPTDGITHRRTNLPTHDVLQRYKSVPQQQQLRWWRYKRSCSDPGISMFSRLSVTPGSEQTLPREAPTSGVINLSAANRRAVVWEGSWITARRREAKWSSGVAALVWGCYSQSIFKDLKWSDNDYYYRGAVYNKDILEWPIISEYIRRNALYLTCSFRVLRTIFSIYVILPKTCLLSLH